MKIGQKLLIASWDRQKEAYADQFGIKHPGTVLNQVVEIQVVESCTVKGSYQPENEYMGFRAVGMGEASGREFFCQWERFDDVSSSAYSNWIEPKAVDISQALLHELTHLLVVCAPIVQDGQPFTHPLIVRCHEHSFSYFYSFDEDGCFYCKHNIKKG